MTGVNGIIDPDTMPPEHFSTCGVYRAVAVYDDVVIKWNANHYNKPSPNQREVELWLAAPPCVRLFLAPIVDWEKRFRWIAMERRDPPRLSNLTISKTALWLEDQVGDTHDGNVAPHPQGGWATMIDYAAIEYFSDEPWHDLPKGIQPA